MCGDQATDFRRERGKPERGRNAHVRVRARAIGVDVCRSAQRGSGSGAERPAAVPAGGMPAAEFPICRRWPVRQPDWVTRRSGCPEASASGGRGSRRCGRPGRRATKRAVAGASGSSVGASQRANTSIGAGFRGFQGSCRSPMAGAGKKGTGRRTGRVPGVPQASGLEGAATRVRRAGRADRTLPGIPGTVAATGGC